MFLRHKELLQCTTMFLLSYRIIDRRETSLFYWRQFKNWNQKEEFPTSSNYKIKTTAHPAMGGNSGAIARLPIFRGINQVVLVLDLGSLCVDVYINPRSRAYFFQLS